MGARRTFLPLSGVQRFDAVFKSGSRVRLGGVSVVALCTESGVARVGLVAGRSVGGAVVRNRAKRRLRAALDRVELSEGMDYVVIATTAVATESFGTVARWVREATEQARAKASPPEDGTEERR
jgi:ribonuclease P protein component